MSTCLAQQQQDWETAQQLIDGAIAGLEDLGALCDLAQAHLQQAHLHQARAQNPTVNPVIAQQVSQCIAYLTQAGASSRITQVKADFSTASVTSSASA